jgi:hypothetical protein
MPRYIVAPISDPECDAINTNAVILETDDLQAAKDAAEHASAPYGAGIADRETGQLDVGFGFGVTCPDDPPA